MPTFTFTNPRPRLTAFLLLAGFTLVVAATAAPSENGDNTSTILIITGLALGFLAIAIAFGVVERWCAWGNAPATPQRASPALDAHSSTPYEKPSYAIRYTEGLVGRAVPAVRVVRGVPVIGFGQELAVV